MKNVAIKFPDYQENNTDKNIFETTDIKIPSCEQFFDMLEQQPRDIARITIINVIQHEFEQFIVAAPYQRSDDQTNSRNGIRYCFFVL